MKRYFFCLSVLIVIWFWILCTYKYVIDSNRDSTGVIEPQNYTWLFSDFEKELIDSYNIDFDSQEFLEFEKRALADIENLPEWYGLPYAEYKQLIKIEYVHNRNISSILKEEWIVNASGVFINTGH